MILYINIDIDKQTKINTNKKNTNKNKYKIKINTKYNLKYELFAIKMVSLITTVSYIDLNKGPFLP